MKVYRIETEEEVDGRWIAEIQELPGVMMYGETREEAMARVQALALRILAEMMEERLPGATTFHPVGIDAAA